MPTGMVEYRPQEEKELMEEKETQVEHQVVELKQ